MPRRIEQPVQRCTGSELVAHQEHLNNVDALQHDDEWDHPPENEPDQSVPLEDSKAVERARSARLARYGVAGRGLVTAAAVGAQEASREQHSTEPAAVDPERTRGAVRADEQTGQGGAEDASHGEQALLEPQDATQVLLAHDARCRCAPRRVRHGLSALEQCDEDIGAPTILYRGESRAGERLGSRRGQQHWSRVEPVGNAARDTLRPKAPATDHQG
jgi:hypothetical protein